MPKTAMMNLRVQLRGLPHSGGLDSLIVNSLNTLRNLIPISNAQVVLEQQRDSSPTYRVFAHLAVPGPDVHAVACDHTLQAAWRKLANQLTKQFQQRASRQQLRLKGRGLVRKMAGSWGGA